MMENGKTNKAQKTTHYPLIGRPMHCQSLNNCYLGSFKKNEIVFLLPQFFLQSITVYTMEYSFGQSWSAVMAVSQPTHSLLTSVSGGS